MTQPNLLNKNEETPASAQLRPDLLRLAEEQNVRPLSFDELLGDPEGETQTPEDITREVDEFLAMLREWRQADVPRSGSLD